jgi:Mitochondrial K+-H+ exchange-related
VRIYLLLIDHETFFFYADTTAASPDEHDRADTGTDAGARPHRPGGVRGWILDKYHSLAARWQHGQSGAIVWLRRAWDWLHSLAHPDEVMLSRLRSARTIDLHHPTTRSRNEVSTVWRAYLNDQWWRHLLWFCVNGAVAPPAIAILWILPGPNLIGYWFLYRAIHHALVLWGIRRVLRNKVPTELYPVPALDLPVERDDDGKPAHAALGGRAARLAEHVAWHERARHARRRGRAKLAPKPAEAPSASAPPDGFRDG